MKKSILILFLVLTGLRVFAQDFGLIREISGTVEFKLSSSASFVPASVGTQVWEDTVISTGFRSSAIVELGSALISVRPLTRLTLTEIRASEGVETINAFLQSGRVRVDIDPPAGTRASMDVVSPVAVSSVRGTSFEFDTRILDVNRGTVSFRGTAGQRVSISAGSTISVGEGGTVMSPVAADPGSFIPRSPAGIEPSTSPVTTSARTIEVPGLGPGFGPGPGPGGPGEPGGPNGPNGPNGPSNPDDPSGVNFSW